MLSGLYAKAKYLSSAVAKALLCDERERGRKNSYQEIAGYYKKPALGTNPKGKELKSLA